MDPIEPRVSSRASAARPADVLVIGGGIAGTSAALHLARSGVRVTLLDRGRLGLGTTGQAIGVLTPPLRPGYADLIRDMGVDRARSYWELGRRSIEGLSELLEGRGDAPRVELDRFGGWILAEPHNEVALARACRAMSEAALPVLWVARDEIEDRLGTGAFSAGLRVAAGGTVDPTAAVLALAEEARAHGARFVEGASVLHVERTGSSFRVVTERDALSAGAILHASHLGARSFLPELAELMTPVRAQAFMTGPVARRSPGFHSTDGRTNVWRQRPDGRVLVSGWRYYVIPRAYGHDDPEIDRVLQAELQRWFESIFPDSGPLRIEREWSGAYLWTRDFLPLAGAVPGRPGEFVLGGFGEGGFSVAFEAARCVAHVMSGASPVAGAELLDPARFDVVRPQVAPAVAGGYL